MNRCAVVLVVGGIALVSLACVSGSPPTPTATPVAAPTDTIESAEVPTWTPTHTPLPTVPPSATPLPTATPTSLPTNTFIPSNTPTPTAETTPTSTPEPTPVVTPTPTITVTAVRGVLFFSPTCMHCHLVINDVLPPLQEEYGEQLVIAQVDVSTEEGYELYMSAVDALEIQNLGVPTLIVGDVVLIGSRQIPEQLPGLIENGRASGGTDWPAIPGFVPPE